jgi:hypothetical protein
MDQNHSSQFYFIFFRYLFYHNKTRITISMHKLKLREIKLEVIHIEPVSAMRIDELFKIKFMTPLTTSVFPSSQISITLINNIR